MAELLTKYQQYEEYKDSGVEWLGEIPQDWKLKRIQELTSVINGYPFESSKFNPIKGMPLVRIRDIRHQKTEVCFDGIVPEFAIINDGDILIGMDGDFNVAKWTGGKAALNQRVACIRHEDPVIQNFLYYLLPYNMKVVNDLTYYTTVKHLSTNDILKTTFAIPCDNDLSSIVSFLDHETAQIDTLIEKQQTLIKLLKEKRQAVISHAVTKGLNPDAPMKDSKVEWLGDVPEHWNVAGFKKYLNSIIDYRGKTPEKVDSGKFLVTARNIKKGEINYEASQEYVSEKDYPQVMSRGIPAIGDVLFTTEAPLGEVAQVDKTDIALAQRIIKFSGQNGILDNTYLKFYIMSNAFQDSLMTFATGSTALGIKSDRLSYLRQLIPPLKEQLLITEHIEKNLKVFDVLMMKAEQAIELMKERRTALISAAVTGKIDVRGWEAPEVAVF